MDTDMNGTDQQTNKTPRTSPSDTVRGTCAINTNINNNNDKNNSWTPVNWQTTFEVNEMIVKFNN